MARTIAQIYDAMITEKETFASLDGLTPKPDDSQTFLADLSTTSKVAIWRLMFWVVAVAIWAHEMVFDEHEAEVEATAAALIPGTAQWLQGEMFKFQFGDTLQFIDGKFQYPIIDLTKQIIKRVAIVETLGQVRVKVAKLDVSDDPEKLDAAEESAADTYLNQIKFAGTNTALITKDADLLKVAYDIHYDPQVLDSAGESIADPGTFPVVDAINGYIQELPFNGALNLTEMTDAVQAADGVVDPVLTLAEAKFGAIPYATIVREYVADAGHMKIDPGFPLSTQITYIANV